MSVYDGDFLGFQFGTFHSKNLNIIHVSSGNRYTDDLIPSFTDSTTAIPGGDGSYYWDTNYNQRTFSVNFAFDDLRDEDITRLQSLVAVKGLQDLIFDEKAYKKYKAKVASVPQIKYICFQDDEFRVYKGEGVINFVAYYPFAFSTQQYIINQKASNTSVAFRNIGDMPTNFNIIYSAAALASGATVAITDVGSLVLSAVTPVTGDTYISIDMETHLVEGLNSSYVRTGNLYNKYITSGDFFKMPLGTSTLSTGVAFNKVTYSLLYY